MADKHSRLQKAVFERNERSPPTFWTTLAAKYDLPGTTIRRAHKQWQSCAPESQPIVPGDVSINVGSLGRLRLLTEKEENMIAEAIKEFAVRNTPLGAASVQLLVQDYVRVVPAFRIREITFKDDTASLQWVAAFIRRNKLSARPIRIIEDSRVEAVTKENVTVHIARVRETMRRFNIHNPEFVFDMDQSGCSFAKMTGRSLRKGIGPRNATLSRANIRTKGNLERVTIMPVVSAAGKAYKPLVVYPGIQRHFRRLKGVIQTLKDVLQPCYLYQREVLGVNSEIIFDWAQKFIEETKQLLQKGQYLLMIIDGYGAHVQYKTLKLLRDNNVIVIAMPAHTSHVLQKLDISVFSA